MVANIVYIVTHTDWWEEDRVIDAVFSKREDADAFIAKRGGGTKGSNIYSIDPFYVDMDTDAPDEIKKTMYRINVNLMTGEKRHWKHSLSISPRRVMEDAIVSWRKAYASPGVVLWVDDPISFKHAELVMNEWRNKLWSERSAGLRDENFNLIKKATGDNE